MSEEKTGLFGRMLSAAVDAGLLEETDGKGSPKTAAPAAQSSAVTPVTISTVATNTASGVNPQLVDQLRKIALAPANSPLTNTFMRSLDKAKKIETDPVKAITMALMFSEIPVKNLVSEIETAIAANLSGHKMSFTSEVGAKRADIDARFAERQTALQAAIADDQTKAEEIRVRLSKNTADLSSLASEKAGEITTVDRTESEALASLAVVEGELNTLLSALKAA